MNAPENLTWSQFVALVNGMLTVDSDRSGVETYRLAQIRQGVIQLQTLIDGYRLNHETVYDPSDFVTEGHASRGVKPPQSANIEVSYCKLVEDSNGVKRTHRHPTKPFDWSERFKLIHGRVAVNDGHALVSIDRQGYTFYIYPEVFDGFLVSMHWDGLKLDFKDDEETPFDEAAAGAVAEFVKGQIEREVNRDIAMHDSHMKTYSMKLPLLFTREKEKRELKV